MNLLQLKSLVAIYEYGSFSAAAERLGRSHSAISLHMKALEEEFRHPIFNREKRPPTFTPTGERAAIKAQEALAMLEEVERAGSGNLGIDNIKLGAVPTTLQYIVPEILGWLSANQPSLQMSVKSGMSNELTAKVITGEIDMALVTAPTTTIAELTSTTLAKEAMFVISSETDHEKTDAEILNENPFIAFSTKAYMGKQISDRLMNRGIKIDEVMEVDSLDTIESLVKGGFGVSIVPQRFRAPLLATALKTTPFCDPQEYRELAIIYRNEMKFSNAVQFVNTALNTLVNLGADKSK